MASLVVPGHEYSGRDVEDLIAALLVRTIPGAQRIDGSLAVRNARLWQHGRHRYMRLLSYESEMAIL